MYAPAPIRAPITKTMAVRLKMQTTKAKGSHSGLKTNNHDQLIAPVILAIKKQRNTTVDKEITGLLTSLIIPSHSYFVWAY